LYTENQEENDLGKKSQNHRMGEVGRDLREKPGPALHLKQGHSEPIAQDSI